MKARFADRRSVPRPSVVGLDTGDSHEDRPTDQISAGSVVASAMEGVESIQESDPQTQSGDRHAKSGEFGRAGSPMSRACFMMIPFPETLSNEDGTLGESWASGVRTDQIIEVSESRIGI